MQIVDTLQDMSLLLIAAGVLFAVVLDRYLFHRQIMKELNHVARSSDELALDRPKYPIGVIGLVLIGIGEGILHEPQWRDNIVGEFALLYTGLLLLVAAILTWFYELAAAILTWYRETDDPFD